MVRTYIFPLINTHRGGDNQPTDFTVYGGDFRQGTAILRVLEPQKTQLDTVLTKPVRPPLIDPLAVVREGQRQAFGLHGRPDLSIAHALRRCCLHWPVLRCAE